MGKAYEIEHRFHQKDWKGFEIMENIASKIAYQMRQFEEVLTKDNKRVSDFLFNVRTEISDLTIRTDVVEDYGTFARKTDSELRKNVAATEVCSHFLQDIRYEYDSGYLSHNDYVILTGDAIRAMKGVVCNISECLDVIDIISRKQPAYVD